MSKRDYLKDADVAFAAQMVQFKENIGHYAPVLNLLAAEVTLQAADADYFAYCVACQGVFQAGSQQWTRWKNLIRDGGNPPSTGAPVFPTFPEAVPAVAPGIEDRFRALVREVKGNTKYNEAMGKALGIEGPEATPPDLNTVQPVLKATVTGTHVHVDWGWQGHSAYLGVCELQVDRGDGKGFTLLAYDTTPGYDDTQPFPVAATQWTYRAIYCVDDTPTGHWSAPVSVMVVQPG
jgi:hypothetical protein